MQPIEAIAIARTDPKLYNFGDRCALTDAAMKLLYYGESNGKVGIDDMIKVLDLIWVTVIDWKKLDTELTAAYILCTGEKPRYSGDKAKVLDSAGNNVVRMPS